MRTGRTRIYVVYFFYTSAAAVFLLPLLGSQELALEGGCTVTALTSRVVVARLRVHVCMSTDLTPERRVYIPCLTSRT